MKYLSVDLKIYVRKVIGNVPGLIIESRDTSGVQQLVWSDPIIPLVKGCIRNEPRAAR